MRFNFEGDLYEFFGETGSCKTVFMTEVTKDYLREGYKVVYIDTEGKSKKILLKEIKEYPNNLQWLYIPTVKGLLSKVKGLPTTVNLVIVDSLLPFLGEYCLAEGARAQGELLKKLIGLKSMLKTFAVDNKVPVLITNQPESSFGKGEPGMTKEDIEQNLEQFGDKGRFYPLETFKTKIDTRTPGKLTKCEFLTFRASDQPWFKKAWEVTVSQDGVFIKNLLEEEEEKKFKKEDIEKVKEIVEESEEEKLPKEVEEELIKPLEEQAKKDEEAKQQKIRFK